MSGYQHFIVKARGHLCVIFFFFNLWYRAGEPAVQGKTEGIRSCHPGAQKTWGNLTTLFQYLKDGDSLFTGNHMEKTNGNVQLHWERFHLSKRNTFLHWVCTVWFWHSQKPLCFPATAFSETFHFSYKGLSTIKTCPSSTIGVRIAYFCFTYVQNSLAVTEAEYWKVYTYINLYFVIICAWMKKLNIQCYIQHCFTLSLTVIVQEMHSECSNWEVGVVTLSWTQHIQSSTS